MIRQVVAFAIVGTCHARQVVVAELVAALEGLAAPLPQLAAEIATIAGCANSVCIVQPLLEARSVDDVHPPALIICIVYITGTTTIIYR